MKQLFSGLPHVREKSGKIIFFQGQGIVREFEKLSGKFWKGTDVMEMSGNFIVGFWKACHIMTFIHKIAWFSSGKLNFLSSRLTKEFPVVLVSCKSHLPKIAWYHKFYPHSCWTQYHRCRHCEDFWTFTRPVDLQTWQIRVLLVLWKFYRTSLFLMLDSP